MSEKGKGIEKKGASEIIRAREYESGDTERARDTDDASPLLGRCTILFAISVRDANINASHCFRVLRPCVAANFARSGAPRRFDIARAVDDNLQREMEWRPRAGAYFEQQGRTRPR